MFTVTRVCALACLVLVGCSSASSNDPDPLGKGGAEQAGSAPASAGNAAAGASAISSSLAGSSSAGAASVVGSGVGGAISSAGTAGSGSTTAGAAGNASPHGGAAATSSAGSGGSLGVAGAAQGGVTMGGAASCDVSSPPSNVSAWIDESWSGQLANNVKTRKAWNLDNVILNKGQMNLCVRWGATSAVPATVRMNLESTIGRWFNDWFKALASYDCFPYPNGIRVKVTGWAVKPGKQALLDGIDPAIPVYTETDGEGEPKCPDACSSFVHWDHVFTGCAAGAANHSDYWLWFDDKLPGDGSAAAVGGDWGLRMPVSIFTDHFNDTSFLIAEHEMGHGFGFQDYYDWTGSTPAGGSLMIVGSTAGKPSPTVGDTWLLRRTWKEMKTLRGW